MIPRKVEFTGLFPTATPAPSRASARIIITDMIDRTAFAAVLCYALFSCATLEARVTRVVVEQRESPAYKGQSFGKAGQYEILSGRFYGELDPKDPHNAIITDIQFAPRNARGMVEYSATFAISKPVDMSHSSGVLFYSVPNRGNGAPDAFRRGSRQRGQRLAG